METTFGLILGFGSGQRSEKRWVLREVDFTLEPGETLGIVGLGRIGSAIATRAKGFDMKIIYHDVYRRDDLEGEIGITYKSLDEVIAESDFLSLHVPLTEETHHMIGGEQLSSMKETAFLINTSRGPVVDEGALYEALRVGVIAGAGLDVFEEEPVDPGSLVVTRIVFDPADADATFAVIGGRAVRAGESVGGWPVFRVERDRVLLGTGGERAIPLAQRETR